MKRSVPGSRPGLGKPFCVAASAGLCAVSPVPAQHQMRVRLDVQSLARQETAWPHTR